MNSHKTKNGRVSAGLLILLILALLSNFNSQNIYMIDDERIPLAQSVGIDYHLRRDFGAKGDGVHNDTAALQAAVNALKEGDTLYIEPGRYLIDRLNIIRRNVTITGSKDSILLCANVIHTFVSVRGEGIRIEGISIDGANKAARALSVFRNSRNISIINTHVSNVFNNGQALVVAGIKIYGDTSDILIDGCTVSNVSTTVNGVIGDSHGASRGIMITPFRGGGEGDSVNVTVQNNVISDIGPREDGDGIVVASDGADQGAVVATIQNNQFNNCAKRAIKIHGGRVIVRENTINNHFPGRNADWTDGMYSAISVYGSNVSILDNLIRGTSYFRPIDIEGRDLRNIAVNNNRITVGENSTVLPFRGVINFHGTYDTVEVTGNSLLNGNMGIYFRNRGTNITVSENKIHNMSGIGINFDGFQYQLFDNILLSRNNIHAMRSAINFGAGQNFRLMSNNFLASRRVGGRGRFVEI
jgi:hypothetical protein